MTPALLASLLLFAQTPAETNAPPDTTVPPGATVPADALRDAMHTYVRGERRSIIPFGLAALTTLTAGGVLLATNDAVARGAAWPLLGFGVIELAAGLFFGLRNERPKLDQRLDEDPGAFAREEHAKVTRISTRFQPLLFGIEGAIIAAGGALTGIGAATRNGTVEGVGIGLAIQGLVFFLLDWAVLDRADDYLAVLERFR